MATSQDDGSALLIAESPDGPADTVQVDGGAARERDRMNRDTLTFES